MEIEEIKNWLKARLQLPLPGRVAQEKMIGRVKPHPVSIPDDVKLSAVMILLFPKNGLLNIAFIKRKEDNKHHSGQISFPGGKVDPTDKDLLATALRETFEEVGISKQSIEVIGALTSIYIPVSKFNVFPYIGYLNYEPEFIINTSEVAYMIQVAIQDIFNPKIKIITDVISPVINLRIPNVHAYKLENGNIIWGATAMILSELETILSEILHFNPDIAIQQGIINLTN